MIYPTTATAVRKNLTGNATPPVQRGSFTGNLLDGAQSLLVRVPKSQNHKVTESQSHKSQNKLS